MYVDISPSGWRSINSPPLMCGDHIVTFFHRLHNGKGEKRSNFTMKKPDKHHVSQMTKVNSNNEKSY